MSNLPPNPYNNVPGGAPVGSFPQQGHNHNQLPPSQPHYGLKQDANSNSPIHGTSTPQGQAYSVNNYNQSSNSSPAFNRPGMLPPSLAGVPPSMLPPVKPNSISAPSPNQFAPPLQGSAPNSRPLSNANTPTPYPPNYPVQQGPQINDNTPPLIPSSQAFQPVMNGPPGPGPMLPPSSAPQPGPYPPTSRAFSPPVSRPPVSAHNFGPPGSVNQAYGPPQPASAPFPPKPGPPPTSHPQVPFSGPPSQHQVPLSGPPLNTIPRNSPISSGLPVSGPVTTGPPLGHTRPLGVNGAATNPGLPPMGPPMSQAGPVMSQPGPMNQGPPMGPPKGQIMGGPLLGPSGAPNMRPPTSVPSVGPPINGPLQMRPPLIGQAAGAQHQGLKTGPPLGPPLQPGLQSGPQSLQGMPPTGPNVGPPLGPPQPPIGLQSGPQSLPPMARQMVPNAAPPGPMAPGSMPPSTMPPGAMPPGPPKSNMQNRYPPMPQSNYNNQSPQMQQQYPQQYNTQQMAQQMGNLSVTKQGFDQLWGHQNIDLMQCRHILPEYPEEPPEIRLGHQFADAPNCSPDIFRCTVNRIPENNSLLQKSRLPLGILIHPFKDLNHLPVIQCTTIVRCRACRTYINPFVYFVDSKRWKCNLCYRVNDLPEEFQYDPVSKSYGDPSRRPEIKSATIEFIAPGEYMLRPPQPAVYLFLLDVSHLARESRYLDVVCKTLQDNLDQLPGDARTQVGFICYDAHIHYYLMSEGLTRPKEMTVLDIDDVFLPSPESLLVNLGERRTAVSELLSALPSRYAATPGATASALGAALQAAYKLMAPTGGRITVFQTCLPNVGPGALTPREDPNARSSKDVAHLNPATDFYKRLALDCSGAQVAVDLFLLNSQYSDLATLSGMSKFSGGTVYHIPLFNASRAWQADQLRRTLQRYLTRKIGFEAVMRVRCTRGITIHTFHGNFFVRSTDLLSLPNVSPDAGFGMQLSIEESLADLQQVCFQAALLYTSSKGERRIRVHTMALPIANTLPDVLHSADQQCIIGLLSKMAVDRCASASMSEAREAIMNVAIDVLSAHRLAQNLPVGAATNSLHAPASLRLLPLYLLALLKRKAFRTGTSTRLDDRVADMCAMKTLPLNQLLRAVYPDLFAVHQLCEREDGSDPPALQLSAERINSTGAYLLDDGETMILYVGHAVAPAYLSETFGVACFSQLPDEARTLPRIESDENQLLHLLIEKLNDDRPYPSNFLLLRDNSPSRTMFTERLVDDRVESSFSYYEFLQHVKSQVK